MRSGETPGRKSGRGDMAPSGGAGTASSDAPREQDIAAMFVGIVGFTAIVPARAIAGTMAVWVIPR